MIPDSPVSRPGLLHVKMRRWMETLSTVVSSRVGIGQGSSTIAWTTRWKGERLAGSARTLAPSFDRLACQRITRRSVRLMRPSSAILSSYVRQMIFNTTGSRSNFQIGRTWEQPSSRGQRILAGFFFRSEETLYPASCSRESDKYRWNRWGVSAK